MTKKIYISGAVRGLQYDEVIKKFARAQTELEKMGYKVINPVADLIAFNEKQRKIGAPTLDEKKDRTYILKLCIQWLLFCDIIYLLPDWQLSEGAKLEKHIATALGVPSVFETYELKKFTNEL